MSDDKSRDTTQFAAVISSWSLPVSRRCDTMIPIWGVFLATLAVFWYWSRASAPKKRKGLKELPGPKGLPFIGNLLDLGGSRNKQFTKWAAEHGSIYQVKMASHVNVVVSDPKLCRELFNDPMVSGRPHFPVLDSWEDSPGLGLFPAEGERWEVHRRFLLRHLRDFGFGKSSMESLIMEEVKEVLELYRGKVGTPVTAIRETLRLAVVNALWSIMSSGRFDQNDPQLLKLTNNTTQAFDEILERGGLVIFMPWLRHVIPNLSGYTALRKVIDDNKEFLLKSVEDHKKKFRDGEPHDFIDVYLAEMKKFDGDPSSLFHGETAERQLVSSMFDLFRAGSDTTATTTAWSVLYLCKFPEIQKRFQQEMSQVTGDTRHVSLSDRPNMPYTNALIDEIFRFSSIVPDGAPHRLLVDREFHGYFLPKDAIVQPNLYFIHFDKRIWGDPENFRPERFLGEDGRYARNENMQAFQVGKRQCLGEQLARDSVFLFVTNIFQRFSMVFDPTQPEPSVETDVGFFRVPLPFSVIMSERLLK